MKWSGFFYFLLLVPINYLNFFLPPCSLLVIVAPAYTETKRWMLCYRAVIHTQFTRNLLVLSTRPLVLARSVTVPTAPPWPPPVLHAASRPLSHSYVTSPSYSRGIGFAVLDGSFWYSLTTILTIAYHCSTLWDSARFSDEVFLEAECEMLVPGWRVIFNVPLRGALGARRTSWVSLSDKLPCELWKELESQLSHCFSSICNQGNWWVLGKGGSFKPVLDNRMFVVFSESAFRWVCPSNETLKHTCPVLE